MLDLLTRTNSWKKGDMRDAEITPKKYYRVMLFFSFAIAFLLDLLLFATAPMVTQIMGEMKLSHVDFGFLFSAAMISLLLFRIPWGLIGDRIGYLNVFRIALPISAASAIFRGVSSNYSTLLMSQILLGFGLAAILPCLPLIVKEWASDRVLGFSTGIYVSGFALGNFTVLGLTPQLRTIMGWKEILLIDGGLATLMALLWWVSAKSVVKTKSEFKLKDFTLVFVLDKFPSIVYISIAYIIKVGKVSRKGCRSFWGQGLFTSRN